MCHTPSWNREWYMLIFGVPWLILCAHTVLTNVTCIRSAIVPCQMMTLIHTCYLTRLWVWRDSFYAHIQYSQVWHTSGVRRESSMSAPWLIRESAMTHSMRACSTHKCDIHQECDVNHLRVCHDSFVSVPWLTLCVYTVLTSVTWVIHQECDVSHLRVCHDSFVSVPWPWIRVRHESFICDQFMSEHTSQNFYPQASGVWLLKICTFENFNFSEFAPASPPQKAAF